MGRLGGMVALDGHRSREPLLGVGKNDRLPGVHVHKANGVGSPYVLRRTKSKQARRNDEALMQTRRLGTTYA